MPEVVAGLPLYAYYLTSTILAGQRQPLWPVGRRCCQTAEAVLVFLRCSVCARFL